MHREMLLSAMQNLLAARTQLVVRLTYHIADHPFTLSQRYH